MISEGEKEKGVIKEFNPDLRKYKNKWGNKKEYDLALTIRQRYFRMADHKASSCPYSIPAEEIVDNRNSNKSQVDRNSSKGTDWALHWNRSIRAYMMYRDYSNDDPNMRVPISYSPIEAIKAEAMDSGTAIYMEAIDYLEQVNVDIIAATITHEESIHNMDYINSDSKFRASLYGTSVEYVGYERSTKEVELVLGKEDREIEINKRVEDLGEEDFEMFEKEIKEEGKPVTKTEEIVTYEGLLKVPVNIYDFFVSPTGTTMTKGAHEVYDCVWRNIMSVDTAYHEFENSEDPYIIRKNINKIVSYETAANNYNHDRTTQPFLRVDEELEGDKVQVLRYYNKYTDKYVILVNDVILRDGPLPFNHKELPFVVHRYLQLPETFWGISLPMLVESQQEEVEVFRNLQIQQGRIAQSPPALIRDEVFESVDSQYNRITPGLKINVDGDISPASIRFLEIPGPRFDVSALSRTIEEDSVKVTGINPMQYAMPTNQPVRNNLLVMESSQKMIRKFFKLWAEGEREAYRQYVSLLQQFLPESYEEIAEAEENGITRVYKKIRMKGMAVEEDEEGKLKMKRATTDSTIELKPEYMQISGQIDFMIDVDSMIAMSKSVRLQALDKAFAQLIPILANPKLMQNPMIMELVKDYVRQYNLPKALQDMMQEEDSEAEVREAMIEQQIMESGQEVPGVPGRSAIHNHAHSSLLMTTMTEMIATDAEGMPLLSPEEYAKALDLIKRVQMHLETDLTPKEMAPMKAMSNASEMTAPPAPPQMGGDMGGMMPPEGAEGTMGLGDAGGMPLF